MIRQYKFQRIAITKDSLQTGFGDVVDVTFINKGTQNVTIDGIQQLIPGDSHSDVNYWPEDRNITLYDIVFDNEQLDGCFLVVVLKKFAGERR